MVTTYSKSELGYRVYQESSEPLRVSKVIEDVQLLKYWDFWKHCKHI